MGSSSLDRSIRATANAAKNFRGSCGSARVSFGNRTLRVPGSRANAKACRSSPRGHARVLPGAGSALPARAFASRSRPPAGGVGGVAPALFGPVSRAAPVTSLLRRLTPAFVRSVGFVLPWRSGSAARFWRPFESQRLMDINGGTLECHNFPPPIAEILRSIDRDRKCEIDPVSSSFRAGIDSPSADQNIYDAAIFVSGWVEIEEPARLNAVSSYLDDALCGTT